MMSGWSPIVWFVDVVTYWIEREQEARLRGICSALALPEVRCPDGSWRKRCVEVEIGPDRWHRVDAICIDADGVALLDGATSFWFPNREGLPRWRVDHDRAQIGVFA